MDATDGFRDREQIMHDLGDPRLWDSSFLQELDGIGRARLSDEQVAWIERVEIAAARERGRHGVLIRCGGCYTRLNVVTLERGGDSEGVYLHMVKGRGRRVYRAGDFRWQIKWQAKCVKSCGASYDVGEGRVVGAVQDALQDGRREVLAGVDF